LSLKNRKYYENVPIYLLTSDYISGIKWIVYSLDGSSPFTIIAHPEGSKTASGSATISGLTVGMNKLTIYAHEECGGMVVTLYWQHRGQGSCREGEHSD
jgi:hypothetical protein